MIKQSLLLSPLLKETIGVYNMNKYIDPKEIRCNRCRNIMHKDRANISNICVDCKAETEGDFKVYIKESLGTREEFRQMSSAQSIINKSIKF